MGKMVQAAAGETPGFCMEKKLWSLPQKTISSIYPSIQAHFLYRKAIDTQDRMTDWTITEKV